MQELEARGPHTPEVATLVAFIRGSRRGVVIRPGRSEAGEDEEA
jgi:hypothetical protein